MITLPRDTLADALSTLAMLVSPSDTIPILRHIVIEPMDGSIRIEATNLDQSASVVIECGSEAADGFALEGRRLQSLVATLERNADIGIDSAVGFATVSTDRSRIKFPTISPNDFPRIGFDVGGPSFDIPARDLGRALSRVSYSHGNEIRRPYLCGAYIDCVDGCLRVVATNGHTFAMVDTGQAISGWTPAIWPTRFTEMLEKRLSAEGQTRVEMSAKGNVARVTIGQWSLTSKVIEGPYVDYKRLLLRADEGHVVDVDCKQLHAAVSRTCLATDLKGVKAIRLDFFPDRISVSHRDASGREGVEDVPATCSVDGHVGFDSRFLLSTLSGVGETAAFEFRGPNDAATIRNPADPSFLALLSPYAL